MTRSGTLTTISIPPIIVLLHYRVNPLRVGCRVAAAIPAPASPAAVGCRAAFRALHQRTPRRRFRGAQPSLEPGDMRRYVLHVTVADS